MPHNTHDICPICNQPGRQLEGVNRDSHVDYFRCDPCWHVWTHSKFEPDGPAIAVTKPAARPSKDARQ
jgi:hypothetical protein